MEWEYYTHIINTPGLFTPSFPSAEEITRILNWYGAQQWELVSTFTTAVGHGATYHIGLVFKRPRTATFAGQPAAPQT